MVSAHGVIDTPAREVDDDEVDDDGGTAARPPAPRLRGGFDRLDYWVGVAIVALAMFVFEEIDPHPSNRADAAPFPHNREIPEQTASHRHQIEPRHVSGRIDATEPMFVLGSHLHGWQNRRCSRLSSNKFGESIQLDRFMALMFDKGAAGWQPCKDFGRAGCAGRLYSLR